MFSAFLSYKRDADADADDWHKWSAEKMSSYLRTNTGAPGDINVFVDRKDIPNGSYWRKRLQRALHHSPILIAFVSRAYFQSPYCMAELQTFMDREDELLLERGTLIHMAGIAKPSTFPGHASEFQVENFQPFYAPSESFSETRTASDFSAALNRFCQPIADKLIHNGFPDHSDDFPILPIPDPPPEPAGTSRWGPLDPIMQPFSAAPA